MKYKIFPKSLYWHVLYRSCLFFILSWYNVLFHFLFTNHSKKLLKKSFNPKKFIAKFTYLKNVLQNCHDMTINDESYFTLSHTTLSGNNRFYSNKTPNLIKNKYVTKFEPKILVYLAISSRGMTRPIFFPYWTSSQSECLQGKMLEAVIDSFYKRKISA